MINFVAIKRVAVKMSVLTLIVSMNSIGATSAYLTDAESSGGNVFSAGSVGLNLKDTSDQALTALLFEVTDMKPGESATKTVRVTRTGTLDFEYSVATVQTGGDNDLCAALQVEAKLDGGSEYNGSLTGMDLNPAATVSGGQDAWDFTVGLEETEAGLKSKTCNFDLVVKGWQMGSDGTWGLMDTKILASSITTGTWDAPGAVVINEIMWMGSSGDDDDEWIELKNTTGETIDLAGWKIEGAGSGSGEIVISTGEILAGEYFLISHFASSASAINNSVAVDAVIPGISLVNTGEELILKDDGGNEIDRTPTGAWPEGSNGIPEKKSMERNSMPGDGAAAGSWHTCEDTVCNDTTYWDAEGDNYGTPRALNHSDNDLSLMKQEEEAKEREEEADETSDDEETVEVVGASGSGEDEGTGAGGEGEPTEEVDTDGPAAGADTGDEGSVGEETDDGDAEVEEADDAAAPEEDEGDGDGQAEGEAGEEVVPDVPTGDV